MTTMPEPLTLGEHLEEWMALQATQLQRSTWASYRATIRRYLMPRLGAVPLPELTTAMITAHYAHLLAAGGTRGRPLGVRSVGYTHAILHKALADAVGMDLIDDNPSDRARRPKVAPRPPDEDEDGAADPAAWSAVDLRTFLAAAADHPLRDLFLVAAYTGLRRGELLGLAWGDLDLDVPSLRVRHSLSVVRGQARLKVPKTGSQRVLHLDDVTVAALRRQRARQEAERRRSSGWDSPWDLVFTDATGRHHSPDGVSNRFRRAVEKAPVPRIRLHDLRHLHATLLLAAGVPVKVVSERLGHATTQLTLDIYAHVLPAMDAEAVERFAELVLGEVRAGG